jgi:hypothetical protein
MPDTPVSIRPVLDRAIENMRRQREEEIRRLQAEAQTVQLRIRPEVVERIRAGYGGDGTGTTRWNNNALRRWVTREQIQAATEVVDVVVEDLTRPVPPEARFEPGDRVRINHLTPAKHRVGQVHVIIRGLEYHKWRDRGHWGYTLRGETRYRPTDRVLDLIEPEVGVVDTSGYCSFLQRMHDIEKGEVK